MSTTQKSEAEMAKNVSVNWQGKSCAKKLTLVDTLGVDRDHVHWETKLLDASTMASFELLSCIFLLIKRHRLTWDGFRCSWWRNCSQWFCWFDSPSFADGTFGRFGACACIFQLVGQVEVQGEWGERLFWLPWWLLFISLGHRRHRHELEVGVLYLLHVLRHPCLNLHGVDDGRSWYSSHCHQGGRQDPTIGHLPFLHLLIKDWIQQIIRCFGENLQISFPGRFFHGSLHWSHGCSGHSLWSVHRALSTKEWGLFLLFRRFLCFHFHFWAPLSRIQNTPLGPAAAHLPRRGRLGRGERWKPGTREGCEPPVGAAAAGR